MKIITPTTYLYDKTIGLKEIADPTPVADYGHIYTKDIGGKTELFYYGYATAAALQITANGAVNVDATKLVNAPAIAALDTVGTITTTINAVEIGRLGYTGDNIAIGKDVLKSRTTGVYNTVAGLLAGDAITSGNNNTLFGKDAGGAILTTDNSTCFGFEAGLLNTAAGLTAFGYKAGAANVAGIGSTFIGTSAGKVATGADNTCIGKDSGLLLTSGPNNVIVGSLAGDALTTTGSHVIIGYGAGSAVITNTGMTFVGCEAGAVATSGTGNSLFGYRAGYTIATGSKNTLLGYRSGYYVTSDSNVCIGHDAGLGLAGGWANVYIGDQSCGVNANTSSASNNTMVGYRTGAALTTGGDNTVFGYQAGAALTSGASNALFGHSAGGAIAANSNTTCFGFEAGKANTAAGTTAVGYRAGLANTTGLGNTYLGNNAGKANLIGHYNTFLGDDAGQASTAGSNTYIGHQSGYNNLTGTRNVLIGEYTGRNGTTSSDRTALGYYALVAANTAGTAVGSEALRNTTGSNNVGVGYYSGRFLSTGANNTFVGGNAGLGVSGSEITGSNNTAIGKSAGNFLITTSNSNTFLGSTAGAIVSTGFNNVLLGFESGQSITTGSNNIVIGPRPLAAADVRKFVVGYHATNKPILSGISYDLDIAGGSDDSLLTTNVTTFTVYDWKTDVEQFRASFGKLSTHGENAPDVVVGGLCLNGTAAGSILSLKGQAVAHGCTDGFGETDTWGYLKYGSSTTGAAILGAISVDTAAVNDLSPALTVYAVGRTTSADYAATSRSAIEINTALQDSVTPKNAISWGDATCIFGVRNNKSTKFIVGGDGKIYADGTYNTYDAEEDIKLVQSFSNRNTIYYERLKELGVITSGGMMQLQGMHMLSIGAIGQLFNIIKALAIKLGVSEDELYQLAKQY